MQQHSININELWPGIYQLVQYQSNDGQNSFHQTISLCSGGMHMEINAKSLNGPHRLQDLNDNADGSEADVESR